MRGSFSSSKPCDSTGLAVSAFGARTLAQHIDQ
jgi:hypothetical protein